MLPPNIERNNLDGGHKANCTWAAGSDCSCGHYEPMYDTEEERRYHEGMMPPEMYVYSVKPDASIEDIFGDDELPF